MIINNTGLALCNAVWLPQNCSFPPLRQDPWTKSSFPKTAVADSGGMLSLSSDMLRLCLTPGSWWMAYSCVETLCNSRLGVGLVTIIVVSSTDLCRHQTWAMDRLTVVTIELHIVITKTAGEDLVWPQLAPAEDNLFMIAWEAMQKVLTVAVLTLLCLTWPRLALWWDTPPDGTFNHSISSSQILCLSSSSSCNRQRSSGGSKARCRHGNNNSSSSSKGDMAIDSCSYWPPPTEGSLCLYREWILGF